MTSRRASFAVALCLLLAGCGGAAETARTVKPTARPPVAAATTVAPSATPAAAHDPQRIDIPAIDAHSTLVPLGLTANGEQAVPPVSQPQQAGWYKLGPRPGQVGPSVILGHVNGGGRPGVFAHLSQLKPGDEIDVDALRFVVTRVQDASKDAFPADQVYGATSGPELRVITCGGSFDRSSGNYRDNIIVYARLA